MYIYVHIRICIRPGVSPLEAGIQLRATRQHCIANPDAIYLQCDAQRFSLMP